MSQMFYFFTALLLFLSFSSAQQCEFNSTHCTCMEGNSPNGKCLRDSGAGQCLVDSCTPNGLVCDCSGSKMCKRSSCGAFTADSGDSNSILTIGSTVACTYGATAATCLSEIRNTVQIGSTFDAAHSFEMLSFTDTGNALRNAVWGNDQWPAPITNRRELTFRIYEDDPFTGQRMICVIYNPKLNNWDGGVNITADATVTGESGQTLSWIFCDDTVPTKCFGTSGTVLTASHNSNNRWSEGFCVGPFEENDNVITFQFANMGGVKSVVFQDPSGILANYSFSEIGTPTGYGLTVDSFDSDGNSINGATGEIKFKWSGF